MNMSKKILFVLITILSFTLFANSVYAACSDVKIDRIGAFDGQDKVNEVKKQVEKCRNTVENGYSCYAVGGGVDSDGACKKSDQCADGYIEYFDRCIKKSDVDDGDLDTKCGSYTKEDDCKTRLNCEWINGTCTNTYVAEDPCSEPDILKAFRFYGYLLMIAKVAIPLIIIIMGTFDLFKSVVDKDEKSLTKQVKILLMRVIAGVFIFFLPTFIYAIFDISTDLNIVNDTKYKVCVDCLLKPTGCNTN